MHFMQNMHFNEEKATLFFNSMDSFYRLRNSQRLSDIISPVNFTFGGKVNFSLINLQFISYKKSKYSRPSLTKAY